LQTDTDDWTSQDFPGRDTARWTSWPKVTRIPEKLKRNLKEKVGGAFKMGKSHLIDKGVKTKFTCRDR
jgi:hypothetical protein